MNYDESQIKRRITHLRSMYDQYSQNLEYLEFQAAQYGIDTPLYIHNHINYIKYSLEIIEKELSLGNYSHLHNKTQIEYGLDSIQHYIKHIQRDIEFIENIPKAQDSDLQLVDVSLIETTKPIKLDIKVRNIGTQTAFLKRMVIHVKRIWKFPSSFFIPCSIVNISHNYQIYLDTDNYPYKRSLVIAQAVKSGDVDRFTFELDNAFYNNRESGFIAFSFTIYYDEDDKFVSSKDIILNVGVYGIDYGEGDIEYYKSRYSIKHVKRLKRRIIKNIRIAKLIINEIDKYDAYKEDSLQELLHKIKTSPMKFSYCYKKR